MLTLSISKLHFPGNAPAASPITVSLYIKDYYNGTYTLIESDVPVEVDGTITASPLPSVSIDPTQKYVLKAVNEECGFEYEQPVMVYPYCPVNYSLSPDESYCYITEYTEATPPSDSENAIAINNDIYNVFGTLIMDQGFNINGTGTFTQIDYSNTFWVNGSGSPNLMGNTSDGALNRCGVWSTTVYEGQQIGYAICITVPESKTYYVGIAGDDYVQLNIDGNTIVNQDHDAMFNYFTTHGYSAYIKNWASFIFWYIYPVFLTAGTHVIEMIGINTIGTVPNSGSLGCEVYNLTPSEIMTATSYGDMGSGLIFSSKDFVGQPIQIGSGGIGYSCPAGYSLNMCQSPVSCVRTTQIPVLY